MIIVVVIEQIVDHHNIIVIIIIILIVVIIIVVVIKRIVDQHRIIVIIISIIIIILTVVIIIIILIVPTLIEFEGTNKTDKRIQVSFNKESMIHKIINNLMVNEVLVNLSREGVEDVSMIIGGLTTQDIHTDFA
jgi:hypothetical protein